MAKSETKYVCQNCAFESPRWFGRCPECGEWNTLLEEQTLKAAKILQPGVDALGQPRSIREVESAESERMRTGIAEFDRVLGGGIVKGSVTLVGGDPGIGKSTLMLQVANAISNHTLNQVLYVSGEESSRQIRLRAERLGTLAKGLHILSETNLFQIEGRARDFQPNCLIVDSIQTVYRDDLNSAPGSVSQVRECGAYLSRLSKSLNVPLFLVGHVTKEGTLAGPKVVEHLVDTVLYFEGDTHHQFRLLRAMKNRFGSTNEIGVFEMVAEGLSEVKNPSELFLSERPQEAPGSVVCATLEGSRPLLVEVQALVTPKETAVPRRAAGGLDFNRMSILIAVLERRLHYDLGNFDVFASVAGGMRLGEPAIDLPLAMAIASSLKNRPIPQDVMMVGEVGLAGEVRAVTHLELRLREAEKLGFKHFLVPHGNLRELKEKAGIQVVGIRALQEAIEELFR